MDLWLGVYWINNKTNSPVSSLKRWNGARGKKKKYWNSLYDFICKYSSICWTWLTLSWCHHQSRVTEKTRERSKDQNLHRQSQDKLNWTRRGKLWVLPSQNDGDKWDNAWDNFYLFSCNWAIDGGLFHWDLKYRDQLLLLLTWLENYIENNPKFTIVQATNWLSSASKIFPTWRTFKILSNRR